RQLGNSPGHHVVPRLRRVAAGGAIRAPTRMTRMGADEPLRERLVDAGVELLEQAGAGQLGLRAIAREAGVSHGAPRRYFPTHNALLAAIANRGFADLRSRFDEFAELAPRERIAATALAYVEFAAARPEMFTLMFRHDRIAGTGENVR